MPSTAKFLGDFRDIYLGGIQSNEGHQVSILAVIDVTIRQLLT